MVITNCISLDKVPINSLCTVRVIDNINRRFEDIGISKGVKITPVFESMFSKTRAYLINGSLFAIRKNIAKKILVEVN